MDDIKILEAVERYITGQMKPGTNVFYVNDVGLSVSRRISLSDGGGTPNADAFAPVVSQETEEEVETPAL